jgi:hypothetical protein
MAKRKFKIVKRENNIPVLGVCEHCHAQFTVDPETIGQPQDAHAFIQELFVAHQCKRLAASQNAVLVVTEDAEMALSRSRRPDSRCDQALAVIEN